MKTLGRTSSEQACQPGHIAKDLLGISGVTEMKTKRLIHIMISAILMFILTPSFVESSKGRPNIFERELAETVAYHQDFAALFEQRAKKQNDLIEEHEQMKQEYRQKLSAEEIASPSWRLKKFEEHHDAIIEKAKVLESEFTDFAWWHRMRATECQNDNGRCL